MTNKINNKWTSEVIVNIAADGDQLISGGLSNRISMLSE